MIWMKIQELVLGAMSVQTLSESQGLTVTQEASHMHNYPILSMT